MQGPSNIRWKNICKPASREAIRWELEAESRALDDEERLKWLEARRLWIDKEREKTYMLRQKARLSSDDANMLERPVDKKEVWEAVNSCGRDKAPGPDGFNFTYIKRFWDVFKKDLIDAIKWFWDRKDISRGSKILAERIKLVIGKLVGEVQNAFIGIFKGIKVGIETVVVSHLQYADDTIFLGEWDKENAKNLMCILKCFERVLGLKVNLNKSRLYGVGVNSDEMSNMASWMQCSVGEFRFTYLGLPIGDCMRRESAWRNVVEKFKKRLSEWKAKTTSFGGRLTLVKSVLGSLPLYYYSMFRVPLCVIKKLESIRREFLWGGVGENKKLPWVKWDKREGDALWVRLIKSIYEESGGLEVNGVGSRVGRSGLWCDIVKVDRRKEARVVDRGIWCEGYGGGNGTRDSWHWNLTQDEDGNFKVKDLAFMVDDVCLSVGNTTQETLWNKLAPKKVNVFVWRVLHGRILVRVELDKRGIDLDSLLCPCCDDSVESCDHSLVTCNMAKSVWDKIFEWWKIGPVNVFSANDLFRFSGNVAVHSYSRALWQLVIWTTGYYIWKERNSRVFKAKVASINKFFHEIQVKSFDWISRRPKKASFDWQKWFVDPSSCEFSDGIVLRLAVCEAAICSATYTATQMHYCFNGYGRSLVVSDGIGVWVRLLLDTIIDGDDSGGGLEM
ncbi:reverse transcriptase domain, reverse transcriptase zinc-binding domain protein [Tanacetum coccineum]